MVWKKSQRKGRKEKEMLTKRIYKRKSSNSVWSRNVTDLLLVNLNKTYYFFERHTWRETISRLFAIVDSAEHVLIKSRLSTGYTHICHANVCLTCCRYHNNITRDFTLRSLARLHRHQLPRLTNLTTITDGWTLKSPFQTREYLRNFFISFLSFF